MMSKLKIVTAAGAAAVFALMLGASALPAIAADEAAQDKADAATAAPADPDTAPAPDAAAPDAAAPADAAPEAAPEAPAEDKPAEPAKPMMAPATTPVAPQKSATAPSAPEAASAKAAATTPASAPIIGAAVIGSDGKEVGKVNRVSSGPNGELTEIRVNTSGTVGLTGALVAIPAGKIASSGDKVKLSLSSEEVSKLPKIGGPG
jgi:hypothetical protein